MTDYREIFRLKSLEFSNVAIANSLGCSRNTVPEVLKLAETHSLGWPIPDALSIWHRWPFSQAICNSMAEIAKANNLKPYEYFAYLLTEIPKHMDDTDRSFFDDLVPGSEKLPESIRKPKK